MAFFGFYFFRYIPDNKERLHNRGFLILHQLKKNIIKRNTNLHTAFENSIKLNDTYKIKTLYAEKLDTNTVKQEYSIVYNKIKKPEAQFLIEKLDSLYYYIYTFNTRKDIVVMTSGAFLNPVLSSRDDLFHEYVLIKEKEDPDSTNLIVYQSSKISVDENVFADSLLKSNAGIVSAQIRDINLEGIPYKLFLLPFHLRQENLILGGLLTKEDYQTEITTIPFQFVSRVLILFIIMCISLPIIKIYFISSKEHIGIWDVINLSITFFPGVAILVLILMHLVFENGSNRRIEGKLQSLSSKIDKSVWDELDDAYQQLTFLDYNLSQQIKNTSPNKDQPTQKKDSIIVYRSETDRTGFNILHFRSNSKTYYQFDVIFWMDSDGRQKYKGFTDAKRTPFIDIKERKYFQMVAKEQPFGLNNTLASKFALEPVYSWTTGTFEINMATKSIVDTLKVAALNMNMHSLFNAILPAGYGFCIIDQGGQVQCHSDMRRNLQENFFEETDNNQKVIAAIKNRQDDHIKSVTFYGKQFSIFVHPLKDLPWYIVTFYDRSNQSIVFKRTLVFVLAFMSVLLIAIPLIGLIIMSSQHVNRLHSLKYQYDWLRPSQTNACFFYNLNYCIILIIAFLILFSFLCGSHYCVFLIFLFPFYILWLLNGIYKAVLKNKKNELPRKKLITPFNIGFLLIVLLANIGVYSLFKFHVPITSYIPFIVFQLFVLVFYSCIIFKDENYKLIKFTKSLYVYWRRFKFIKMDDFQRYCTAVWLLIISIVIIPVSYFYWYAQTQEIKQDIKMNQLHLAKELQRRYPNNLKFVEKSKEFLPTGYYDTLHFKKGIYMGEEYKPIIDSIPKCDTRNISTREKDTLYYAIINGLNINYWQNDKRSPLGDQASDSTWFWVMNSKKKIRFYHQSQFNYNELNDANALKFKTISLTTSIPSAFSNLNLNWAGFIAIVLLTFSLAYGLWFLIKSITYRLFLIEYFQEDSKLVKKEDYFEKIYDSKFSDLLRYLSLMWHPWKDRYLKRKIQEKENEWDLLDEKDQENILCAQQHFTIEYERMWQECSQDEKYFLYDIALEGLANYKNTDLIVSLLQKGLLIIEKKELKLFSHSFCNFILSKRGTTEIVELIKVLKKNGAWSSFRTPFLIVLLAVSLFVLITQKDAIAKIIALAPAISVLIPLLANLFSKNTTSQ